MSRLECKKIFQETYSRELSLQKDEWERLIDHFMDMLQTTRIGCELYGKMIFYLARGYQIEISNCDNSSRYIYPKTKMNDKRCEIIIPSLAYFIEVETIDPSLFLDVQNDTSMSDLVKISQFKSSSKPIKTDEISGLTIFEHQPLFITFVHELIHCIRYFEGLRDDDEEDATIYGVEGKTLVLNGEEITENAFRKLYKLNPRVSHNNRDVYIHDVPRTYENRFNFSKEAFFYC